MGSFSKIWDNPIVNVSDLIASYFVDYFALLTRISISHPTATSTAMAQSVLHSILLGINALYANRPQSILAKSRKEEICQKFVQLVIENYMTERRAQFYADKLGISLQHLSTALKAQHYRKTSNRKECTRNYFACGDYRRQSTAEIHRHDYSGNSLFTELPQCLFLRKVL